MNVPATSVPLGALRACIERLEAHGPAASCARSGVACGFGIEAMDARFAGGGLGFGAHEVVGAAGEGATALLFAALLLARRLAADGARRALVVQDAAAVAEGGAIYPPGLRALGLDPGRLACATLRDGAQTLRVVDEALRAGAVCAVVAEMGATTARRLDLSATQRFNVFAARGGTLALLVTPGLGATSAALSRWRVAAAPSRAARPHLGAPAFALELTRNRHGPTGRFEVEWSSDDGAFRSRPARLAPPLRPPVAAAPVHRPALAHVAPRDPPARAAAGAGGG